jgi:hypothetical protein
MFLLFNFQSFNSDALRLSFAPQSSSTAFPQSNHLLTPTRCAKASLNFAPQSSRTAFPQSNHLLTPTRCAKASLNFAPQS